MVVDTERGERRREFALSISAECVGAPGEVLKVRRDHLAALSAGARDDNDTGPPIDEGRDGQPGGDRLVVGMSVNE
jgi:hypothetical protein